MTADNVLFEIKGLKKNFGDLEVLKGIHTTIRKGEVVVVIGPSGSGKSTFIRCLNLLETPTEGQIFFEGSCITDKGYAVHKHREKVGMVFQQFNLFNNLTILENVTISLKKVKKVPAPAAEEKARALLRRVGLEDKADAYPAQLSGGQKQRIAIVRAMAMEPDVMLFDEPMVSQSGFIIVWKWPGEFRQFSTARPAISEAGTFANAVMFDPNPWGYPAAATASHSTLFWWYVTRRDAQCCAASIRAALTVSSGTPFSRRT